MFAIPFGRILWKEYRVQRSLWLSCLLIGFLFQILVWWFDTNQTREGLLFVFPAFFSIMYAVGCGALLFASEREERTCEWLLCLSTPVAPTLGAKIAMAVLSTFALQLGLALTSLILSFGVAVHHHHRDFEALFLPFGLLVLVWSFFGSLLSRRALVSVLATAFWGAVIILIPHLFVLYSLGAFHRAVPALEIDFWSRVMWASVTCTTVGVDIWLGWRWCQGKYLDGGVIEDFNSKYKQWRNNLIGGETTRSHRFPRVEHEQSWRRTWQRLVWQERHRETLHLLLLSVGCVVGFVAALESMFVRDSATFVCYGTIFFSPIAIGVFAFQADAGLQQPRFLLNRGLSPGGIWLAKQFVWLPRAFWITGVVFCVSAFCEAVFVTNTQFSMPLLSLAELVIARPDLVIWVILLGYGCGQTAAILCQRTILALVFGLVLNGLIGFWFVPVEYLSLPRWWSLGLPVVALLVLPLWQMKPWLLEEHSWSRKWRIAATLFVLPMTLITLFIFHRVNEVSLPMGLDPRLDPRLVDSFRQAASAQLQGRTLTALEENVRGRLLQFSERHDSINQNDADEIVELLKQDVDSVLRKNGERRLSTQNAGPKESTQFFRLNNILAGIADDYLRNGMLDKSFDCLLADLKLARLTFSQESEMGWDLGSQSQSMPLEQFVNWANHTLQSPASIRAAVKQIQAELDRFPSETESIVASYVRERNTWVLSSRIEAMTAVVQHNESEVGSVPPLFFFLLIPSERKRADMLMTRDAKLNYVAIKTLESRLSSPKLSANQSVTREFSDMDQEIQRFVGTTPLVRPSHLPLYVRMQWVLNRHANIRAAMTRMELIAYRLEHGKLPERLIQLMPTIDGIQLVDPWSGRIFDYYPQFLLSSGYRGVELLPASETSVEIRCAGSTSLQDSQKFDQIISGTSEEVSARISELKKDSFLSASIFPIPLPSKPDPQE